VFHKLKFLVEDKNGPKIEASIAAEKRWFGTGGGFTGQRACTRQGHS